MTLREELTDSGRDPVGIRIAKRRHQMDLTQAQLAVILKVARSTVADWERGDTLPIKHAGKIEKVLGITLTGPAA
jgi:ribosome-binding protein aMBF1 (putative translation factor)